MRLIQAPALNIRVPTDVEGGNGLLSEQPQ